MITDLQLLQKEYNDIFTIELFSIKRIINTGIYCILHFHQNEKPLELLIKINKTLKAYDCRNGIEIDDYVVIYRYGQIDTVIKEVRRIESIRPFYMACNGKQINKRINKE